MFNRVGKLLLLAGLVLVASCETVQDREDDRRVQRTKIAQSLNLTLPQHDCLQFWGVPADQLIPLMEAMRSQNGRGWACKLQSQAVYDALCNLAECLKDALDESGTPCARQPDGTIPDQEAIGQLALSVCEGLSQDRVSGGHENPNSPGWLLRGGTPGAIAKAQELWTQCREALDM